MFDIRATEHEVIERSYLTWDETEMKVLPTLWKQLCTQLQIYNGSLPLRLNSMQIVFFFILTSAAEKYVLQLPNPAQSEPWEAALHVWAEYPQAAEEEFVQPNLHCVVCDFFPCCRTRVICCLCCFKSGE